MTIANWGLPHGEKGLGRYRRCLSETRAERLRRATYNSYDDKVKEELVEPSLSLRLPNRGMGRVIDDMLQEWPRFVQHVFQQRHALHHRYVIMAVRGMVTTWRVGVWHAMFMLIRAQFDHRARMRVRHAVLAPG
jgi:hypothetical protein